MYYGTQMKTLNFGVKSSVSRNNICWNHHCTGEGIQYLKSCVEFDFLVAVVSHTQTHNMLVHVDYHNVETT